MSEFSDSYHIGTDHPDRTKQQLRGARLAGIVFGPKNGWLTFVPYEEHSRLPPGDPHESFTKLLARQLSATVLHYRYGEDYGWTFALAEADGSLGRFACWWHPEQTIERDGLQLERLIRFAPADAIEPWLRPFDGDTASQQLPAYHFAEALGLPAYKWLSPHIAQYHPEDLLLQGGKKLGSGPRTGAERLQLPPPRTITLPRPDPCAREAFNVVRPFMSTFERDWQLCYISGHGNLDQHGRLDVQTGGWSFTYFRRDTLSDGPCDHITASFRASASPTLFVRHGRSLVGALPPISGNWLDSSHIPRIIEHEPFPQAFGQPSRSLTMSLRQIDDPRTGQSTPFWEVRRRFYDPQDGRDRVAQYGVDALSGEVIIVVIEEGINGKMVATRQWLHLPGGSWEEGGPDGR